MAYAAASPFGFPARTAVARSWHRACLAIVGIRWLVEGQPVTGRAILCVANHVSYLDIPLIGASIEATFIAKAEVASWPVFGQLARMSRTIMVSRRRSKAAEDCHAVGRTLLNGNRVVLFAEGTSTGGLTVGPFRSSLFEAAYAWTAKGRVDVQPITVAYAPAGRNKPTPYAWYNNAAFAPHFLYIMSLPHTQVTVRFHPPLRARHYDGRKALSAACRTVIADSLAELTGHAADTAPSIGAVPAPHDRQGEAA